MRKIMNVLLMVMALGVSGLAVSGCDNDGPAEEAGENIDQAIDDAGDSMDEAGEEMQDEYDDATN